MKLIIVGGVAGGASAATRARRLSEAAEIVLFERGPDVSFANCGLPYYIGGVIEERDRLLVASPESLRTTFRIDVRLQSNVEAIDRVKKTVLVRDLVTNRSYEESYDKLILAPGAAPLRPPLPGIDLPGIHTLRHMQDMDRIRAAVDQGVKQAIVIGAGFIGLELVENLVHRGVKVALVELQDQILPPLDKEMTTPLMDALKQHGVAVHLGQSAESFTSSGQGIQVQLKSGQTLAAPLVILGVGVRPENQLAAAAGLEVGPRGGIRVNAQMQTSDPDVYAVGDAIESRDFITGDPAQLALAGPANRQGRLAAEHALLGRPVAFRGFQGTSIVGCFQITAAMTGASEKSLRRASRPFHAIYVHPSHHAGYYPGAEAMTIKLLFEPKTGKIWGAQIVGRHGVDKRIDVLAIAIQAGMTVFDLEQAELAYAPQYGSAKDPINMAGFVAAGLLRGDHPQITAADLLALPEGQRPLVLDVRTADEFAEDHLPGAKHIPVDGLRSHLGELPKDRSIVTYCRVGQRGYLAARVLLQHGFQVRNLSGGIKAYRMVVPN